MSQLGVSDPGVFGYGFAAAAFLAFAVHLGLGWRGGAKASILLGVVAASAAWAGANLGFSLTGLDALWRAQAALDALCMAGWLAFLSMLLQGARSGLKALALVGFSTRTTECTSAAVGAGSMRKSGPFIKRSRLTIADQTRVPSIGSGDPEPPSKGERMHSCPPQSRRKRRPSRETPTARTLYGNGERVPATASR